MSIGNIILYFVVYAVGFFMEFAIVETKQWFPAREENGDNMLSVLACIGSWLSVAASVVYLTFRAFREAGRSSATY